MVLVVLASCHGSRESSEPRPATSAPFGELHDTDPLSPTVEFFTGGMTDAEVQNSVERGVARCMKDRGWTYEPLQQEPSPSDTRTIGELRSFRRQYGYGDFTLLPGEEPLSVRAADHNERYRLGLSDEERERYDQDLAGQDTVGVSHESEGAAPGSCRATARSALGLPLYNEALMDDMRSAYDVAIRSTELSSAISAWSACMKSKGYQFGRPGDAEGYVMSAGQQLPDDQAINLEIAVGSSDFECALVTVLPVEYQLEEGVVADVLTRFPEYNR